MGRNRRRQAQKKSRQRQANARAEREVTHKKKNHEWVRLFSRASESAILKHWDESPMKSNHLEMLEEEFFPLMEWVYHQGYSRLFDRLTLHFPEVWQEYIGYLRLMSEVLNDEQFVSEYLVPIIFYRYPEYLGEPSLHRPFMDQLQPRHLFPEFRDKLEDFSTVPSTQKAFATIQQNYLSLLKEWLPGQERDPLFIPLVEQIVIWSSTDDLITDLPIEYFPEDIVQELLPKFQSYLDNRDPIKGRQLAHRLIQTRVPAPFFHLRYLEALLQIDRRADCVLEGEHWLVFDWNLIPMEFFSSIEGRHLIRGLTFPYQKKLIDRAIDLLQEGMEKIWGSTPTPYASNRLRNYYHTCLPLFTNNGDWVGASLPVEAEAKTKLDYFVQQILIHGVYPYRVSVGWMAKYVGASLYPLIAQTEYERMVRWSKAHPDWLASDWTSFLKRLWAPHQRWDVEVKEKILLTFIHPESGSSVRLLDWLLELSQESFQTYCWDGQLVDSTGRSLLWELVDGVTVPLRWEQVVTLKPWECPLEEVERCNPRGESLLSRLITVPTLYPHLVTWCQNNYQVKMITRMFLGKMRHSGEIFRYPHLLPGFIESRAPYLALGNQEVLQSALRYLSRNRLNPTILDQLQVLGRLLETPMNIWNGKCQRCQTRPQHLEVSCCQKRLCLVCNQKHHQCPWCRVSEGKFQLLPIDRLSPWEEWREYCEVSETT